MPRAALPFLLAGAVLAVAPSSASALDEQGYWAVIDRMQARMDRYWDERAGYFDGNYPTANGEALLVYSVAAQRAPRGPARNAARPRRLVDALVSSPPYVATLPPQPPGSLHHA